MPPPAAPPLAGLDAVVSLFAYEGAGREVVAALKFTNHRDALGPLAAMLAATADAAARGPFDLVTWVPTTAARRRRRGYDQAQMIAGAVGRSLGVPVCRTLLRHDAAAQTGRGRADRLATRFDACRSLPGARTLVVDDVRTTGASLAAAAVALRRAGARGVVGATLAATPAPVAGTASDRRRGPLQC